MSEHSKPIKHVFVPQPPTEQEQQAWDLAAANAQSVRIMHDELTAAQQRVVELGIALREVSSAVGAGMGDGETVSNPDALAKAILEQVDTHIRISREAGRNEAQQRVAELEADILDHKTVLRDKRERIEQLKQRVAELEQENAELKRSLAWYKIQAERPFRAVTSTSGVGEPIFKHPLADEPQQIKPGLSDDASQKQCNKCGRKTVDMKEIKCRMTQPDGSTCTGSFVLLK